MLRKATSNRLLQRFVLARRRSRMLFMAAFAAVVVALLALGVPDGSAHAQSEPQTVGRVTGLTASPDGQPPGSVLLTWNAAENAQVHFVLYIKESDVEAGYYGDVQMRVFNGTEGTIDGLAGDISYLFAVAGMRFNISSFNDVWGRWSIVKATPARIPGREDLYQPIRPPMAPAYMDWRWETGQDNFRELVTDFTIHNDVGDWSDEHGYYLILIQNEISGAGFYFGVQTDVQGRGKGVIFSRWGTRDLANAKWDETHGWTQSSGHEGDFIGVRRYYNWGQGDYRVRIAPEGRDADGEWFGLWITDLTTYETTWIGSLKFPLLNGTATFGPYSSATIELYGYPQIRPIDIPQWHVSVKPPMGDGATATWGFTRYPFDDSENALPNSDVRYDPSDGAAHLILGGTTERKTPAVGRIDFISSDAATPTVVTSNSEYSYSIPVTEGWEKEEEGKYTRSSPWSRLRITSQDLTDGVTLEQYTAHVRDNLEEDWWPTRSLFEITSFRKRQIAGQDFYAINYRVQESSEYCVLDVAELVTVSNALPGRQHGFRVRMWMCEKDVPGYGQDRSQILDSFRVTTQPTAYYRQFLSVKGTVIKATGKVDPEALYVAGDIVGAMLSGRQDIADCMAVVGAGLAIIPKDEYITTLPEFAWLKGQSDFTGRTYESFQIRGLGAVKGQPVSATSEESLLGLDLTDYPHNRFPFDSLATVHEFAHGIQNLCFTQSDWQQWEGFYNSALRAGIFPGTHMMADVLEFFAVFSTAYFEVTDEIGRDAGRGTVEEEYPDIFKSLNEIYGGAALPPELRVRRH